MAQREGLQRAHPPERVPDDPGVGEGAQKDISGLANLILVFIWNVGKTRCFAESYQMD